MKKLIKSINGKYTLLTIGVIIFWIFASFLFVDRMNRFMHIDSIHSVLKENLIRAADIRGSSNALITTAKSGGAAESLQNTIDSEQITLEIITSLNTLESDAMIIENLGFQRRIRMIKESCTELNRVENEYISLLLNKGNIENGIIARIRNQLEDFEKTGDQDQLSKQFNRYLITNNPDILDDMISATDLRITPLNSANLQENILEGNNDLMPVLLQSLKELLTIDQRMGFYRENGLTGDLVLYNQQINNQLTAFSEEFADQSGQLIRSAVNRLFLLLLISGILAVSVLLVLSGKVLKSLEQLKISIKNLTKGTIPPETDLSGEEEFRELSFYLRALSANLQQKTEYVRSIAKGIHSIEGPMFDENDKLGKALTEMHDKFLESENEYRIYMEEEEKRNWHNEGMAAFGEIFRSERENVYELAFQVLEKLVKYMDASQGSIFILNDEAQEDPYFDQAATFAFDRRKFNRKKIYLGEGLAGTCALEKQTIYLTEIPDDYIEITSGLGESKPSSLLIVPLKLENEIFGILEIASLKIIEEHEIKFVEQLAESISASLAAVRINIKTLKLLEQSRKQEAEMLRQEEKMRNSMNELERAQEESRRKETEIIGILNAVHASSLVAEFSLNGRFSDINTGFTKLLETTRDQVIGKHHSEFAIVDKYSDDYKKFWLDLKNGEIKSVNEKFRLLNGKEIWLGQTYTPIRDEEGNTLKILNIACDITEKKLKYQLLEDANREIQRLKKELEKYIKWE